MRKNFTLFAVLLVCQSGIAQISSGDRILKTSFDLEFSKENAQFYPTTSPQRRTTYGSATADVSTGKLINSNTAILYGLGFSYGKSKSRSGNSEGSGRVIGLSPSVTLQKFYPITSGIYYIPDAAATFFFQDIRSQSSSGADETINALGVRGALTPFAVGVSLKKNMMLTLNAGKIGVEYSHQESKREGSVQELKVNTLSLFANSNSWAVGVLFNLGRKS